MLGLATIRPLAFLRTSVYVLQIRLAKTKRGQPKCLKKPAHQLINVNRTKTRLSMRHIHALGRIVPPCAHPGRVQFAINFGPQSGIN